MTAHHSQHTDRPTVALIGNSITAFRPFRIHLLRSLAERGYRVVALYPQESGPSPSSRLNLQGIEERNFFLDTFSTSPLQDFRCLTSLRGILRAIQPSHVLSFTIKPVVYGSIAASMERVPHIHSLITGLGYLFTGSSLRRSLLRRYAEAMYSRSLSVNRRVFFQNRDDLELFVRKSLVEEQQSLIVEGSGVDTDYFKPEDSLSPDPSVSFVGRLLWDKGLGDLVAAARLLKRTTPVRIIVAGGGSENPASVPRRYIDTWRDEGLIDYRGHVSDVRPILAESWGVVLPSLREGCSRAVQEALSAGKPVITTDAPGCRDSIIPGEQGLIVPTRDPVALSEAIACLVRSPALRAKMGVAARLRAMELYDQERITSNLIAGMGL